MIRSGYSHVCLIVLTIALVACQEVVVVVENIPENTPGEADIYITGNFNYWDPGDAHFELETIENGQRIIKLPLGKGAIDFKFTRGGWNTVETDICGDPLKNRHFEYGSADTLFLSIESWTDTHPLNCPEDTTVIKIFPK